MNVRDYIRHGYVLEGPVAPTWPLKALDGRVVGYAERRTVRGAVEAEVWTASVARGPAVETVGRILAGSTTEGLELCARMVLTHLVLLGEWPKAR